MWPAQEYPLVRRNPPMSSSSRCSTTRSRAARTKPSAAWIEDVVDPGVRGGDGRRGHAGRGLVRGTRCRRRALQEPARARPRLRRGPRRVLDRRHLGRRVRHRRVHRAADRRRRARGRRLGRLGADQRGDTGQRHRSTASGTASRRAATVESSTSTRTCSSRPDCPPTGSRRRSTRCSRPPARSRRRCPT